MEVALPQVSKEEVEAARARMIQVSLAAAGSAAVRLLKAVAYGFRPKMIPWG